MGLLYDLSLDRRDDIRGEANHWCNWTIVGVVAAVVCAFTIPPLASPCAAATGFAAGQWLSKSTSAAVCAFFDVLHTYLNLTDRLVVMDHIRRASEYLQKIWMFATLYQMNRDGRFEIDRHRFLHFASHMEGVFHINISRNWTNSEYVAEFLGQGVTAFDKMLVSVGIDRL